MWFRKLKPKTSPRKKKPLQTVAIREKVKAEDADYFNNEFSSTLQWRHVIRWNRRSD